MSEKVIVVGVDDSETAARAATIAAELAVDTGAALHIVSAYGRDGVTEIEGEGSDRWLLSPEKDAMAAANQAAAAAERAGARTTVAAVAGKPVDALLSEAERVGATMIVVGNRHVQGVSRVLGSVAGAVAHRAPCDVYIAHTVAK